MSASWSAPSTAGRHTPSTLTPWKTWFTELLLSTGEKLLRILSTCKTPTSRQQKPVTEFKSCLALTTCTWWPLQEVSLEKKTNLLLRLGLCRTCQEIRIEKCPQWFELHNHDDWKWSTEIVRPVEEQERRIRGSDLLGSTEKRDSDAF